MNQPQPQNNIDTPLAPASEDEEQVIEPEIQNEKVKIKPEIIQDIPVEPHVDTEEISEEDRIVE